MSRAVNPVSSRQSFFRNNTSERWQDNREEVELRHYLTLVSVLDPDHVIFCALSFTCQDRSRFVFRPVKASDDIIGQFHAVNLNIEPTTRNPNHHD